MELKLYETNHGDCPYLPDRTWTTHAFTLSRMPESAYEKMLGDGWRRSGDSFYRNRCAGCSCCTPIRIPVEEFVPSRSQRRSIRRNADVRIETGPTRFDEEVFALYRRYVAARHPSDATISAQGFVHFLGESPVETRLMRYLCGDRLVAAGWVDVLSDGLSSVYFAFDPEESDRSLGVFSVVTEAEYARSLGMRWLYLGFYVPGSPKMSYKGAFQPREFALDGGWTRDESAIDCGARAAPEAPVSRAPNRDPQ